MSKEKGSNNEGRAVGQGTKQTVDEMWEKRDQQGMGKMVVNKGRESGKGDQCGKGMREPKEGGGVPIMIEDVRKGPAREKVLDNPSMHVEGYPTLPGQLGRVPLSDCTNTQHLGEGMVGTVKKAGTKGQWKPKARMQGQQESPKEDQPVGDKENMDRKRGRNVMGNENKMQDWKIQEKRGRIELTAQEMHILQLEETIID